MSKLPRNVKFQRLITFLEKLGFKQIGSRGKRRREKISNHP